MDIIAVTETWLKPDIKDCELQPKLNFAIFREDRLSRQGGGVMLAIRNIITCVRRKDLECNAETLFCEIRPDSKRKFLIAVFHRPPDSTLEYMKELRKSLRMSSEAHFDQLFLCGDFNLPNINWKTGTATTNDAIYNCFTKLIRITNCGNKLTFQRETKMYWNLYCPMHQKRSKRFMGLKIS